MANISKIKLPDVIHPYDIIDKSALHSSDIDTTVTNTSDTKVASAGAVKQAYEKGEEASNIASVASQSASRISTNLNNNTYKFLTYKDNTHTEAQIKALTSAKVGDFYIASDTGTAWVCVTAINGTASASSWEKAGSSADVSAFVTAVDAGVITDTVPQTFEGHQVGEFVLKTDVVNNLTSTATNVPLSAAQGKALNDSVNAIKNSVNITQDYISALADNKLNKSGGIMTGILKAQSNTSYTTAQVRNIIISPNDPSGGNNGDIWIKYVE